MSYLSLKYLQPVVALTTVGLEPLSDKRGDDTFQLPHNPAFDITSCIVTTASLATVAVHSPPIDPILLERQLEE
jgi:hypothetical protein